MRDHKFAFVDIEATGLNLLKHEIIEIGCVVTDPELNVLEEFDLKIAPDNINQSDPVSIKISHYNTDDWKDAIPLEEGMKIFASKVKDCIMVGQNVAFDSGFLEYAFAQTGVANPMHYHKLDTIAIAWAKLHREPDLEHFSLREMCMRFGIENPKAHTALSDARATYELYKKLMAL